MEMVPDEWRGRAYAAVNAFCTVVMLVLTLVVGRLTESLGVAAVFVAAAAVSTVLLVLFCCKFLLPVLNLKNRNCRIDYRRGGQEWCC